MSKKFELDQIFTSKFITILCIPYTLFIELFKDFDMGFGLWPKIFNEVVAYA